MPLKSQPSSKRASEQKTLLSPFHAVDLHGNLGYPPSNFSYSGFTCFVISLGGMELLQTVPLITIDLMLKTPRWQEEPQRVIATSSQSQSLRSLVKGHVAQYDPQSSEFCKVFYQRAPTAFLHSTIVQTSTTNNILHTRTHTQPWVPRTQAQAGQHYISRKVCV